MTANTPDWAALRGEFPTLARWNYLDVARKTIPPRCQERPRENHRVVTNVKDDALRLSMSFFNNEENLEKAVHAIKRETSGKSAAAA